MGSIMSAISDDIDEYCDLCRKYGEQVQSSFGSPDCYGPHAQKLKERARKEYQQQFAVEQAKRVNAGRK